MLLKPIKMKHYILFIFLFSLPFIFSCNSKKKSEPTMSAEANEEFQEELQSFFEFYKKFHEDSLFQIEHIIFPLPGLPGFADSLLVENGEYFYLKPGWRMLKAVNWDTTTQFERRLEPLGLGIINEFICTHDNFCLVRRFSKLSNGWNLIYYEDFNYRGGGINF